MGGQRRGSYPGRKRNRNKGLLAIALFKWFKGALLLVLAFGSLKLLHRDVGEVFEGIANKLRVDPDNRYLGALLAKLNLLDDTELGALSGLTFAYSALFLTEGTGLFFEKRWAEFLTIIATASFIPLELYELFKTPSLVKSLMLVINAGIVAFPDRNLAPLETFLRRMVKGVIVRSPFQTPVKRELSYRSVYSTNGRYSRKYLSELARFEEQAKAAKLGGWGR